MHDVVEHNRHTMIDVFASDLGKFAATFWIETEIDFR